MAWHPGHHVQMSRCTSGISLEFVTDADEVVCEVVCDDEYAETAGVLGVVDSVAGHARQPHDGVSCDVDGRHLPPRLPEDGRFALEFQLAEGPAPAPGTTRPQPSGSVHILPGFGPEHHVRIWLPCLRGCAIRDVVCDGSHITPVGERARLLVLGDSISQGFVAGDPAFTWPVRVSSMLGLDPLDQAISGQVFQESSLPCADAVGSPVAIVVAYGENYRWQPCGRAEVARDVRAYLDRVARQWPDVPTLVVTPTWHSPENAPVHPRSCFDDVASIIAREAARHPSMRLAQGSMLLDHEVALLADACEHPSAEGLAMIATRVASLLGEMVPGLSSSPSAAAARPRETDLRQADVRRTTPRRAVRREEGPRESQRGAPSPIDPEIPRQMSLFDVVGTTDTEGESEGMTDEKKGTARVSGGQGTDGAAKADDLAATALEVLEAGPARCFPLAETIRRGIGEVRFAEEGAVLLVLPDGNQMLYAPDVALGEKVVRELMEPTLVTLSTPSLAGVVHDALGLDGTPEPFHLAIYQRTEPLEVADGLECRILGEEYASTIRDHYSHPEFFTMDEFRRRCREGLMIGGFDAAGELVGYIGNHVEGSMGMLEVFDGFRRHGYATILESAKVNHELSQGHVPWAQIFLGNEASIALQRRLGLTLTPADEQCFIAG
jgi:hypothetical protein